MQKRNTENLDPAFTFIEKDIETEEHEHKVKLYIEASSVVLLLRYRMP